MYKIIDNFLDEEDLNYYKKLYESNNSIQKMHDYSDIPKTLLSKYAHKFKDINLSKVYDTFTLSINKRGTIGKHIDKQLEDETHKVLLYLNYVPNGGTIFYIDNKEELVENKENRLVIFDIRLFHKSQIFGKGDIKKTIGFRIKINDN